MFSFTLSISILTLATDLPITEIRIELNQIKEIVNTVLKQQKSQRVPLTHDSYDTHKTK